jgi:DNA-binding NtrC family response regulator
MQSRLQKILVVEPDPEILEVLVASLTRRLDAYVTCVADGESCLETDLNDPHDLVIAEFALPDLDGLELAEKLLMLSQRPIILLADDPTCDEAVEAMRMGVRDLFRKPFPVEDLLDATERLLHGQDVRRQHAVKYRRVRKLLRRVLRERRDLNKRIELICCDLVQAHRRLLHRVLTVEALKSPPTH